MVVTDAGAESGVFDYALKNGSIDRNAIPAFEEFAPVKSLKPGAEALAVHPSALAASATPRPLFAVQRFGLGRSAVLATDPLWRWRMTIPSKSNFFESFWAGSIAWLSAGRDLRPRWNLTSLVVPSGKPCRVLFSVPPRGSSISELDLFAGRENAMKPLAMNASSGPRLYEGFVTITPGERLLRRAVKNGQDREARNGMAYANSLAGIAISVGIVTVCHGLAHSIGGLAGSTHGETLATMTPQTMRFSMRAYPDKFRKIAMFLRDECGAPESYSLEDSIREVEALIKDIGLGQPLSQQGLKEKDIERAADGVVRYMGGSITNDPAAPKREDLVAMIRKVF